MVKIILASGSPRRQELLQRMGLREFEISVPDVEEWYPPELVPEDIVAYISREKSQAVQAAGGGHRPGAEDPRRHHGLSGRPAAGKAP